MRLCNSHLPEEHFVCYQTSQHNWVIIKELYRCLQRYMLGWHISRLGFVTPIVGEVSLGPLGNAHQISLASIETKELVMRWCITERVKRLGSNEIELGMKIPTIESRASNIPMDKGNYVCCHNGLTDKNLRRICRRKYGHPGSAIHYLPERCLGHVYIVLEPVGSARLMFVNDIVLYELCMLVTVFSESRIWSRTWRGAPEWSGDKDWYIV